MTDQPTATARLAQLEQDAVAQAGALTELGTRLQAATDELAKQRNATVEGHADGDPKAVERAKKACRVSRDKLEELTMECDGAKLRADRAREAVISFTRDNARELIRDLEPEALAIRDRMLEALTVLVNADQEWSATHTRMTTLLQAGGYRPQGDLPAGHGLNSEIAQLRFVAEGLKELVAPVPHFHHTDHRERENEAAAARAADQPVGPGSEQDVSRRVYAW